PSLRRRERVGDVEIVDDRVGVVVVGAAQESAQISEVAGGDQRQLDAPFLHGARVAGGGEQAVAEAAAVDAVGGVAALGDVVLDRLGGAAPAEAPVGLAVGAAQVAVVAGLPRALLGGTPAFGVIKIERLEREARGRAASFGARADDAGERSRDGAAAQSVF